MILLDQAAHLLLRSLQGQVSDEQHRHLQGRTRSARASCWMHRQCGLQLGPGQHSLSRCVCGLEFRAAVVRENTSDGNTLCRRLLALCVISNMCNKFRTSLLSIALYSVLPVLCYSVISALFPLQDSMCAATMEAAMLSPAPSTCEIWGDFGHMHTHTYTQYAYRCF